MEKTKREGGVQVTTFRCVEGRCNPKLCMSRMLRVMDENEALLAEEEIDTQIKFEDNFVLTIKRKRGGPTFISGYTVPPDPTNGSKYTVHKNHQD